MECRYAVLGLLALGLALTGCQGAKEQRAITIPALGFTMEIPAGWKVGKPNWSGKHVYAASRNGRYCFQSLDQSYPLGAVRDFPLPDSSSLEDYVRLPGGLHGQLVSETPGTVSGCEAIEVIGTGFGEAQASVRGIHEYIRKGDKVIVVSFLTTEEQFLQQEPEFRQALGTITIK